MSITEFSVKNYQFTIIIFVMALAIGINSLFNMPKSEDPEMHVPQFVIIAVYPGTSPQDIEELLVDPIEAKVNELENVRNIKAFTSDGLMVLPVEFEFGSDPEEKFGDLLREVNSLRSSLPQDLFSLEIRKFSPSDVSILQIALVSETAPYSELEKYAKKLKDEFEKINNLKNVKLHAFPQQQVRIALNLDKMAQSKIPLNYVLNAVQSENANIPGGSVDIGPKKFNIKTSGDYESIEEIRNTVILSNGQDLVRLKDISDVSMNYEEETYLARINGKRCVFVTVSMKDDQNIFAVREKLKPLLSDFQKELPNSIKFNKSFDQSDGVTHRILGFARDFTIAIILVLLTLLPLGLRAAIVVMISIPLSLAIGLALLDTSGFSVNQLSVAGLVVALGLLVDDSIVVVENIERFLRLGYSRRDAAIKATEQISLAVLGCTAVLIFAFLPLAFLPEASGEFIRSLPMAVITTVLASLFVSLTIVPFLSSLILENEQSSHGNIFMRGLKWLISGSYRKILNRAVENPVITLTVAFGIFIGCLFLIPVVGITVFPKSDKPQFLIEINAPLGTSLAEMDKITREVETKLAQRPNIKNYATNVGKGNPRIYYNVNQKNESPNYAEIFVQLNEVNEKDLVKYLDDLRKIYTNYPKARVEIKQFEQGPPLEAPLEVRVLGDNLDTLRHLAFEMENLLSELPGTMYINNPLTTLGTDVKIEINKDKAGLLGISTLEIDRTIRLGIAGINVGKYKNEQGDEYNINITVPRPQRQTLEALDKIYISSQKGVLVPLKQVANIQLKASPTSIRHYQKQRYVIVSAFVKSGFLASRVTQEMIVKLDKYKFPKGYTYNLGGEFENSKKSFGGIGTVILITFFGIMAILILEFRTFKSAFIVISVVPLGIIGAVLMLLFTGTPFSFTAIIGLIALVGIEIKNTILLVDYTNQLRENGLTLDEAIEEAGETRFVPIILTTLTAIGGLIPLVLERSPLYSPLALVIIGGLISSTILTRFVTPVLYKLLPPKIELKNIEQTA